MHNHSQEKVLESISKKLTPEDFLAGFDTNRIIAERDSFGTMYSTFDNDQERVGNLKERFAQEKDRDEEGAIAEAVIFHCLKQGALGSQISARGTTLYDDFFHGADLVVESKMRQLRDPIISSVDVTISQQTLGDSRREMKVAFDKKVTRVRKHIDSLSNLSSRDAIEISAWLQSGGLSQERTINNQALFDKAEELMLLKYYKTPLTSEDPNRPRFVLAGPQVVTAIDRSFLNKVFHGNDQEKALKDISTLLQAQIPFSVLILKQYIESLKKRGKGNVFLDANLVACRAWELTFNDEIYQAKLQKALQECHRDPQLRQQLAYYQQTVSAILR